jgi:hypothetical protein
MKTNDLYDEFLSLWIYFVNNGLYEKAAEVDMLHYNELINKTENNEVWDRWQIDTQSYRKNLVEIANKINPFRGILNTDSNSIALVFHNYSGMAHEIQMARNINFMRTLDFKIDLHIIYAFGNNECNKIQKSSEIFQISKSQIHFLKSKSYIQTGYLLNKIDLEYKFKTIIYPSTYYLGFWSSIISNHPNQKFISMKYYPLQVGRFSDYGGGRGDANTYYLINSQKWKQLSILDLFSKLSIEEFNYEELHKKSFTFGSISRIEKSTDQNYQNFIINSLEKKKEIFYYYCGKKSSLNLIDMRIRTHERSKFLGWTSPNASIKLFSIYLETFPWGGGDMSLLALKTGIPYLTLGTMQNKKFGIYRLLKYISSINSSDMAQEVFCDTEKDLEVKFSTMVDSFEYRQSIRNSWLNIIENYIPTDINEWEDFLLN